MEAAAAQKAAASGLINPNSRVPGVPPAPVLSAIDLVLREWNKIETERVDWSYQKAEFQARIEKLEKDARDFDRTKADLSKRCQILEYGLRHERAKGKKGEGEYEKPSGGDGSKMEAKLSSALGAAATPALHAAQDKFDFAKALAKTHASKYLTVPSSVRHSDYISPGRLLLREYLISNGYLKEAQALDDKFDKLTKRAPEQADEPFKLQSSKSNSKQGLNIFQGRKGSSVLSASTAAIISAATAGVAITSMNRRFSKPKKDEEGPEGSFSPPTKDKNEPLDPTPEASRSTDSKTVTSAGSASSTSSASSGASSGSSANPMHIEQKAALWKPLITLRSHIDGVRSVCFHATEPILISASEDGTAKYWNIADPWKNKKRRIRKIWSLYIPLLGIVEW